MRNIPLVCSKYVMPETPDTIHMSNIDVDNIEPSLYVCPVMLGCDSSKITSVHEKKGGKQ